MADSPVIVTVLPEYQNEVVVSSEEGSIFFIKWNFFGHFFKSGSYAIDKNLNVNRISTMVFVLLRVSYGTVVTYAGAVTGKRRIRYCRACRGAGPCSNTTGW